MLDDDEVLEENDIEEVVEYLVDVIRDGDDLELLQNFLERKFVWLEVVLEEDARQYRTQMGVVIF